MARNVGEIKTRALVIYAISDLAEFLNVNGTMNAMQIGQTAQFILDDYSWLTIDDMKLCFNLAKKGAFGQVYGRLDGQVILEWFRQYETQRVKVADEVSYQEHQSLKESNRATRDIDLLKTVYKKFNSK